MLQLGSLEEKNEQKKLDKKQSKPIEIKKTTRQQAIKNCATCGGNPLEVTDFKVVNFCGKKCEACFLIISYERISSNNKH